MTPVLSIFIPTYNRAQHLKEAVESIIVLPEFSQTDKVEIVISDNASSDNTQEICEEFLSRFPGKIIYHRNSENLGAELNTLKLTELTNGEFVKLLNDTVNLKDISLKEMLTFIEENKEEKPVLVFLNKGKNKEFLIKSSDDLLKKMSYYLTWYGTLGIWKEDFPILEKVFSEHFNSMLPQVIIAYDTVQKKKKCKILAKSLFEVQHIENKSGYNVAKVFGKNYIDILNNYKRKGEISFFNFEREKILLLKHINLSYFDIKGLHDFDKDGYFRYLMPHYWYNPYFYLFYFYVQILKLFKK